MTSNRLPLFCVIIVILGSLQMAESLTAFYVGSFSSDEITVYYLDKSSLLQTQTINAGFTPTWITEQNGILYATNEQNGDIVSLSINNVNGRLSFVDRVSSSGQAPTFLTVAPSGDYVLAANYGTGSDVVIATSRTGVFGQTTSIQQHNGSGPVPGRQTGPHAHQIIFDNPGHIVYSADLGADKIYQYRFIAGVLQPLANPFVSSDPGDGPRHLALHPSGNFAYLACELSSSVIAWKIDINGDLKRIQKLPTISGPTVNNYPAEAIVHPNGNLLFISNRGNDSISVFRINPNDGTLAPSGTFSVHGAYPRGMVLDPSTNTLFTMNQNSGTITAHGVDPTSGHISFIGQVASDLATPVCAKIVPLKA